MSTHKRPRPPKNPAPAASKPPARRRRTAAAAITIFKASRTPDHD